MGTSRCRTLSLTGAVLALVLGTCCGLDDDRQGVCRVFVGQLALASMCSPKQITHLGFSSCINRLLLFLSEPKDTTMLISCVHDASKALADLVGHTCRVLINMGADVVQLARFSASGHLVREFNLHRFTVAEPWGFDLHGNELVAVTTKGIAEYVCTRVLALLSHAGGLGCRHG